MCACHCCKVVCSMFPVARVLCKVRAAGMAPVACFGVMGHRGSAGLPAHLHIHPQMVHRQCSPSPCLTHSTCVRLNDHKPSPLQPHDVKPYIHIHNTRPPLTLAADVLIRLFAPCGARRGVRPSEPMLPCTPRDRVGQTWASGCAGRKSPMLLAR